MPIHKSIQAGDLFFRSHYMAPASHFKFHFPIEPNPDFYPEEIEEILKLPFMQTSDYYCDTRRARTVGSFFPSLDQPILEAAGFTITNKEHAPFFRPIFFESVDLSLMAVKEFDKQRVGNAFSPPEWLKSVKKAPHAVGVSVMNQNLFFETLAEAKQKHSRQILFCLIQKASYQGIRDFLEEFSSLTRVQSFYDLFTATSSMLEVTKERDIRDFLHIEYITSVKRIPLSERHHVSASLESLSQRHHIDLNAYASFVKDETFHDLAYSVMNDSCPWIFHPSEAESSSKPALCPLQQNLFSGEQDLNLFRGFLMVYYAYHHSKYVREHSLFETFVSLYTDALKQRLEDERETNQPLYAVLGKRLTNDILLRHDYLQDALVQDYQHPLFNPQIMHQKMERTNEVYYGVTVAPPHFADTYFNQGGNQTFVEMQAHIIDKHVVRYYPGFDYHSYLHYLPDGMRRSASIKIPMHDVDQLVGGLHPTNTYRSHVPFEIFRHKEPTKTLFDAPSALTPKFELS